LGVAWGEFGWNAMGAKRVRLKKAGGSTQRVQRGQRNAEEEGEC
jgi:hypothetical protein